MAKNIVIITGASSGLGIEFAEQLDVKLSGKVDEIWLIARREDRLKEVASRLKHAKGVVVALDLTAPTAHEELKNKLSQIPNANVCWLVNNAGFGAYGQFEKIGLDQQLQMMDLNMRSLVALTHVVLPFMTKGSRIVQVASSAGFLPLPGFSAYAATKTFVTYFSVALSAEVADRGITVTTVCPGPVATEFKQIAAVPDALAKENTLAQPQDVVALAIKDAVRGRLLSVYGSAYKALRWFSPVLPNGLATRMTWKHMKKHSNF